MSRPDPILKQLQARVLKAGGGYKLPANAHLAGLTPRRFQADFLERLVGPSKNIIMGGAKGPGKTAALVFAMFRECLAHPGYKFIFARHHQSRLGMATWPHIVAHTQRFNELYPQSKIRLLKEDGRPVAVFANGSRIIGTMLHPIESFLGLNADGFAIDQIEETSEAAWGEASLRTRGSEIGAPKGFPLRMIATANKSPGWVKRKFADPFFKGEALPEGWEFIDTWTSDNPDLARADPVTGRSWIDSRRSIYGADAHLHLDGGEWSFSERIAVQLGPHNFMDADDWTGPEPGETVYAGMDFGVTDPTVILFFVVRSGALIFFGEIYRPGTDIIGNVRLGREICGRNWPATVYGPHDMDRSKHNGKPTENPRNTYRAAGMHVIVRKHARQSIEDMRMAFTAGSAVFVEGTCLRTVADFEQYSYPDPETVPEGLRNLPGQGPNHVYSHGPDAARAAICGVWSLISKEVRDHVSTTANDGFEDDAPARVVLEETPVGLRYSEAWGEYTDADESEEAACGPPPWARGAGKRRSGYNVVSEWAPWR